MPRTAESADILVIGGGIIGIVIALELRSRQPSARIVLLDKEQALGQHASGRNSGILHAGFYYTADSLKAHFTRDGNRRLTECCLDRGLPINRCGKLVVAQNADELAGLDELRRRAKSNGVQLDPVSAADAREIEPRVRTYERALYSPTTSSVDREQVLQMLAADARDAGVSIRCGVAYRGRRDETVSTSAGLIRAGYVVNAAGLYADKIARDFGFSEHYRILSFKGIYLYGNDTEDPRTNVFPVPNLDDPFLGLHFTVTVKGSTKIGPTAIPAFWREQYAGLTRFDLGELAEILTRGLLLFVRNDFQFRDLALHERGKYRRRTLVRLASRLVSDVDPARYSRWGRPGIRAQLLDLCTRRLEMDFHLEGDERSMHVLNAVSPAFTCSLPFAAHVADRIEAAVG